MSRPHPSVTIDLNSHARGHDDAFVGGQPRSTHANKACQGWLCVLTECVCVCVRAALPSVRAFSLCKVVACLHGS
jgi:hypothetical protein